MAGRRIIFALPMARGEISGGIRNSYRHAELLRAMGVEAIVYSPEGHPTWFKSAAEVVAGPTLTVSGSDLIVVPETIDAVIARFLALNAEKQMFCQNHYYSFNNLLGMRDHSELSITEVYCSCQSIAAFYRDFYGYAHMDVVPYAVDGRLFFPRAKRLQIAYVPRKRPLEAQFIRAAFQRKWPRWRKLPWLTIDNCSEEQTAEIMGESAIFLALSVRDALGLTPLEAMLSGCLVVGFHGGGGLEYAREDNGRWFSGDQLVECVDALGAAVEAVERDHLCVRTIIAAGMATAARYSLAATREALAKHFERVIASR